MNDECSWREHTGRKIQITSSDVNINFAESETWPQVAQVAGVPHEATFIRHQMFQELHLLRVHAIALLEQVLTFCGQLRLHLLHPHCCHASTPLSSRDSISTLQQVIAGLAACQTSIQVLLKTVESSNERIKDLSEKLKTLDDKVDKLSSDQVVDGDRSGKDELGVKRKRTKASLLIQVSLLPTFGGRF